MRIRSIRIRNYKALQNVEMRGIPGFAVLVGANGAGKSTFIGVFDFLKDCLKDNVRHALQKRGGFSQVVSRGHENETIDIELKVELDFHQESKTRLVTYLVEIGVEGKKVVVERERLSWKRGSYGAPFHFIDFSRGKGGALAESFDAFDSEVRLEDLEREEQELDSPDILAIKGLGQFKRFDAASQFRELIENWSISDFHIEDARAEPDAALAEHLSATGDNLALYAQYLQEEHPNAYKEVLQKMATRVPGIAGVETESTDDGRVFLRFRDEAFEKTFIARAVSDGTIKIFAYLALLHDPDPHPLLGVEEPENYLYPMLLDVLAEEFAAYAERRKGQSQVFVTTHSPDFLNAVELQSIYWLEKSGGFSTLHRAADNEQIKDFVNQGDLPGWLWRQGLFEGVDP